MCHVQIHALCDKRFSEVLTEETDAELAVEEVMSQVLLALFGEGTVEEVRIRPTSQVCSKFRNCSIHIQAQSPCHCFTPFPRKEENMERAIENSISVLLRELFISVSVDRVTLSHEPWSYESSIFSTQDYGGGPVLFC